MDRLEPDRPASRQGDPTRRLGRHRGADRGQAAGPSFSSRLRAVRRPPRCSYGRSYWLRARGRSAGNSLDPQEGDFGAEQPGASPSRSCATSPWRTCRRARPARRRNDRAPGRGRVDAAYRDPQLQRRAGRQRRADLRDGPPLRGASAGERARPSSTACSTRVASSTPRRSTCSRTRGSRCARPAAALVEEVIPIQAARPGVGPDDVRRLPRRSRVDLLARPARDRGSGANPRSSRRRPRGSSRSRSIRTHAGGPARCRSRSRCSTGQARCPPTTRPRGHLRAVA